jgi:hypothetical protein
MYTATVLFDGKLTEWNDANCAHGMRQLEERRKELTGEVPPINREAKYNLLFARNCRERNGFSLEMLDSRSLNDVESLYKNGQISESLTETFIGEWNESPHRLTLSVLRDGAIRRDYDKERKLGWID